jgi:hypothetical protein
MKFVKKRYPNISDIFALKLLGRKKRARLTFSQKLTLLDNLRERIKPIVRARYMRKQQKNVS